jgi:alcohol dehydrogenase class IV
VAENLIRKAIVHALSSQTGKLFIVSNHGFAGAVLTYIITKLNAANHHNWRLVIQIIEPKGTD